MTDVNWNQFKDCALLVLRCCDNDCMNSRMVEGSRKESDRDHNQNSTMTRIDHVDYCDRVYTREGKSTDATNVAVVN